MAGWEWAPPRRKSATAIERPQEREPDESPTPQQESGTTHRSAATTAEKAKRRPASDPSPRRTTTPRWPAVHSGTSPVHWTPLGPEGWSARPLGYQSRRQMSILDWSIKDSKRHLGTKLCQSHSTLRLPTCYERLLALSNPCWTLPVGCSLVHRRRVESTINLYPAKGKVMAMSATTTSLEWPD